MLITATMVRPIAAKFVKKSFKLGADTTAVAGPFALLRAVNPVREWAVGKA